MKSSGVNRRDAYLTNCKNNRPYALALLNDEYGFTLVQALWQIQLYLFLTFGCIMLFSFAEKARPFEDINQFSHMEWKQTVQQLDDELNRAVAVRMVNKGGALEFITEQGQVVIIEQYKDMLRKRIDQAGHLPLLQKVKRIRVRTDQQTAMLQVIDLSGTLHEAVFFTYKGVIPKP
ncbi:competence type IV pilus minor pilin ComGF [Bacillus sp. NPDC093026]|uniref:competence type IV pilus minor pilin ComGF n=1 Tax=Bacillus sp. NPDC093026 TaxID=3363948 RepID=UPI00382457DF